MESRFTPNWLDAERSSSANFTRSRICFSIRRLGDLQIIDHGLGEGRRQRGRPVGDILVRDPSGERQRFARRLNVDILVGEGLLQQLAQRIQVLFHRDVVEVALAGLAPDHQRRGPERFAVKQDLAGGDRDASTMSGLLVEIRRYRTDSR